jgi:predicted O-linked N-acetylglucosamine transferase (SPINDLY family)
VGRRRYAPHRAGRIDLSATFPGARSTRIAQEVAADELDVLVFPELGMHPDTFALAGLRLAPVQCAGWGHPDTTGLPNIDWFISCAAMEPEGAQGHYSERLALLPGLGTRYAIPPRETTGTRADFGLPEGRTIYLVPQSLFKIHPDNDELVAEVLARDSSGVALFFASSHEILTQLFAGRVARAFQRYGLDIHERAIFMRSNIPHPTYLRLNELCDVMIDTLHWSGGNTSLDALASGLPVVTLPGRLMRGRQSAAMLDILGLPELVAADSAGLVATAVRLGRDSEERRSISERIAERRGALFEREEPVRALEEFLVGAGRRPSRVSAAPPSAFSQAQQLHAKGDLERALALYEQCLRDTPDDWRALTRLGLLRMQQRRFDLARELLERAVAVNPANAEAHAWLGETWRGAGGSGPRPPPSGRRSPSSPTSRPRGSTSDWLSWKARNMAPRATPGSGSWSCVPAIPACAASLRTPRASRAHSTRRCRGSSRHLERFGSDASAAFELASIHDRLARLQSAIEWYRRAAALAPDRADIRNELAVAHHNFAEHAQAVEQYRAALALRPDFAEVHSNLLVALHYVDPDDCEPLFREHLAWAAQHAGAITPAPPESFPNDRDPQRRLRIGYVSPRLNAGPVAHNLLPLLQAHDHARFHVTCYSTSPVADAVTDEIRSHADNWREASTLDDAALLNLVGEDAIDILVDLSGHCPGHRLRMFAHRAAPIQMTWLDYSNTTGLGAIDYFVGDPLQVPVGTPQRYAEEVVRLPDTRLCYRPPAHIPQVVPPPALRAGYVTFGCINRLSKLNPSLIAAWSEILKAVPASRLLLKGSAYASAEVRAAVEQRFASLGIGADRLDLRGFSGEAEMMAEYGDIDVCLDPFPYNGSTTTCDALTMGVPVVTLAGTALVGRAGLMFLTACGMESWIAHDRAQYVRIACDAARDPERLAGLRQDLRARFLGSPVCDAQRFTRAFEDIYRTAWMRYAAGR